MTYYLFYFYIYIFIKNTVANEPVDIWKNAEKKQNEQQEEKVLVESQNKIDLSKIKTEDQKQIEILEEGGANKSDIKLVGLFDPQENDLNLDMWSNTDGETIKNTLKELKKLSFQSFQKKCL